MKRISLLTFTLSSFAAVAQNDTTFNTLNEVIVTANKFEQKQKETGKVVTVITQQQLQQNSSRLLTEVLNEQTGIIVSGNANNLGTNQAVYVRGASSGNTLILIDGVPVYDASGISSEFDLNYLNINQVERIEILKGAQSTLYGSDAVAGVINIITKKSGIKPFGGFTSLSGGSYGTFNEAAGINGKNKKWQYELGYTHIHADGFSSAYDKEGNNNFDKDRFSQQTLNASVGVDVNQFNIRAYSCVNGYKADVDAGAYADDKDYTINNKNFQLGTTAKWSTGAHKFVFNYQYNKVNRGYIDDSSDIGSFAIYQNGKYKSYSHFAELYGNFKFSNHAELTAGGDYRHNSTDQSYFLISDFGPYKTALGNDSAKTDQFSLYALLLLKNILNFNLESGARINNHSLYGWNATYSFTPSYNINNKIKLFANIASAYKTPSLYQLYGEFGNTKLKPEQSVTAEGGLQYADKLLRARVVYFKRNIKDVIKFYTNYTTYESFYINADRQNDNGIEAELGIKPMNTVTIAANYTYIDGNIKTTSDITSKDTSFFNLYRRPHNVFNFNVNWQPLKLLTFAAHLRTVSSYFEGVFAAPPINTKGYYTLDVYGEYKPAEKLSLFANAHNITNQQYFDIPGYNSKRFNFMAGARFIF